MGQMCRKMGHNKVCVCVCACVSVCACVCKRERESVHIAFCLFFVNVRQCLSALIACPLSCSFSCFSSAMRVGAISIPVVEMPEQEAA